MKHETHGRGEGHTLGWCSPLLPLQNPQEQTARRQEQPQPWFISLLRNTGNDSKASRRAIRGGSHSIPFSPCFQTVIYMHVHPCAQPHVFNYVECYRQELTAGRRRRREPSALSPFCLLSMETEKTLQSLIKYKSDRSKSPNNASYLTQT